ncbi:Protein phosphatase 2C 2 [Pleurotus pulmonarius]|nr:Protein phosphatase 2C 2 [Pleurotus pulmonarius]KAF4590894.1 Protein phosphatase 2C 2 [Pleurotus pulmonarius]
MGQILSSPITTKRSETGRNDKFMYSVSDMQGWRISMEDAHATLLQLEEGPNTNAFFAVYDGHGGSTVARFAGQNVHKRLLSEETYQQRQYETALKKAFLGTDEDILANPAHTKDPSGCTAVAALVTDDGKIYVANAGDSRSVISVKGEAKPLSFDHKPSNPAEVERITGAGGYVEFGRVNGNLALSRALGDFEFKKNYSLGVERQVITADPDVTCHDMTEEDEFLVLACDGIWDCLSSQQVVDFIRYQISEGKALQEIGELMCDHCLAPDTSSGTGVGCDNMTVLIVALLHGRTPEEWYAWVKDRVQKGYGYNTPSALPQLYSQSRLMSYRARREAQEARERERERNRAENPDDSSSGVSFLVNPLSGFARVLGSTGGISFSPDSNIMTDGGPLMFADNDSDDDDDEEDTGRSFFSETLGIGRSESPDPTRALKAGIDELELSMRDGANDGEDDAAMDTDEELESTFANGAKAGDSSVQGEAPPPPKPLPNGTANGPTNPVEQPKSEPGGDAAPPVVKQEGLMDKSEDPTKA